MKIERVEKLCGFAKKNLERMRMQKSDETVEMKGFKGFFERVWKRKRQLKMTVDEATCRTMGKKLVERQKAEGTDVRKPAPEPRRSTVT